MHKELKNFARSVLSLAVFLLSLTLFFFSMGPKTISVFGVHTFIVAPTSTHSFASLLFAHIQTALVPEGVTLIVVGPLTAFLAQVKVALFLAFVVAFPFLLHNVIKYLRPALYTHERRIVFKVLFSSSALFVLGCLFAYFIIIPPTFAMLYRYAASVGATLFFGVGELVALTFGLVFVIGILFLLPVCMFLMSRLGLIPADVWKTHWRYALFSFLVISAIITPDGSGISMLLLTLPLSALYGVGTIISKN